MVKNNFVFIARRNILVATAHPQQAATLLLDLVHTKFDQTGLPNPTMQLEVKPRVSFLDTIFWRTSHQMIFRHLW